MQCKWKLQHCEQCVPTSNSHWSLRFNAFKIIKHIKYHSTPNDPCHRVFIETERNALDVFLFSICMGVVLSLEYIRARLMALGFANFLGAFFGSVPTQIGLSRSLAVRTYMAAMGEDP